MAREFTMSEIMQLLEHDNRSKRQYCKPPSPPRDPAHRYFRINDSSYKPETDAQEGVRETKRKLQSQQRERERRIQIVANEQDHQQYVRDDAYKQLAGKSEKDNRVERHRAYTYRELNGDSPWEPAGWSKRSRPGPQGYYYPGRTSGFTQKDQAAYEVWYERDWCMRKRW